MAGLAHSGVVPTAPERSNDTRFRIATGALLWGQPSNGYVGPVVGDSVPFDRVAERYEETRGGLDRGRRFALAIDGHLQAGSTTLEIGVGTAAVARPLRDLGHVVVGLDLSRPMLELASSRLAGSLVEADAAILPFADAAVDAIVAAWAIHVIGDFDGLVEEVRRVLKPGGRWLVVSPTPDVEPNDVMDIAYRLGPALGRGWDRSEVLAPRLDALGFRLVTDHPTDEYCFSESPAERADAIERRDWSSLWELDDETWAEVIQPILDDLRALPEPERRRDCIHRHRLSVYQQVP